MNRPDFGPAPWEDYKCTIFGFEIDRGLADTLTELYPELKGRRQMIEDR